MDELGDDPSVLDALVKWKKLIEVMPHKTAEELQATDFEKPFLVADGPAMQEWTASALAQGTMAKWAGAYKKDAMFQQNNTKSDPLDQATGLALAEKLFGVISKPVQGKMLALDDISKTWGTTSWKFACSTDYFNAGMAPNSSALLKYQVMGDIVYYVFDISKLGPDVLNAPGFSMKGLKERIGLTSAATPDEQNMFMLSPQLVLHQGYAAKGMVLYVPAGFVIIEFVAKGPLNFGLRKSLFVDQASAKASYASTVSLLEKEGTNVVRMKTILAKFS
jgi:hypothetical protein